MVVWPSPTRWPLPLEMNAYWLLLIKVLVVATMVLLAIVNRYAFVPALERGGLYRLRLGTLAEIALTAVVLGLVSWIGVTAPG